MPDVEKPEHDPEEARDPHVTALGRGADPGQSDGIREMGQGIAGPRGANVPNEKGGPEGIVHRSNEDEAQSAR